MSSAVVETMSGINAPPRRLFPSTLATVAERFDVQVARDKVLVRFRGRLVRTLTGADADEIRAAVASGDDAAVQLLVARKTGNFKRGNERRDTDD